MFARVLYGLNRSSAQSHCYHIFSVAVNERLLAIPSEFKNAKIGQKPRLGRKPKAKKGDALKKN